MSKISDELRRWVVELRLSETGNWCVMVDTDDGDEYAINARYIHRPHPRTVTEIADEMDGHADGVCDGTMCQPDADELRRWAAELRKAVADDE